MIWKVSKKRILKPKDLDVVKVTDWVYREEAMTYHRVASQRVAGEYLCITEAKSLPPLELIKTLGEGGPIALGTKCRHRKVVKGRRR